MTDMSRRTFQWVTGGSTIALATDPPRGLVNKLIPKQIPPEDIAPGDGTTYATTCRECPAGCGVHLSYRDGRVPRARGNPGHPVNRGGLCPRGQSTLQGSYDPDRSTRVLRRSPGQKPQTSSWDEALIAISSKLRAGARVTVLSSLQTGALAEVMTGFAAAFGPGRLLFHEAFNYEAIRAAHQQLFGLPVIPRYDLEQSDFILSFAADFLENWLYPVSHARRFPRMRPYPAGKPMQRMAYVGPRLSWTASNADTFLQVPAGYERVVAAVLLKIMLERGWQKNDLSFARGHIHCLLEGSGPVPGFTEETLLRVARAFSAARAPVALAGPLAASGPVAADTALWVGLLNYAAGAVGNTVDFSRPHALSRSAREAELAAIFASLGANDLVFEHDTNPAYSRPGAAAQLSRAGCVVYLGTRDDQTAQLAHWVLPIDSPLESWGEYQPEPGISGLMQPCMGRLHDTRGAGDLFMDLARLAGRPLAREEGGSPPDFAGWLKERWGGDAISCAAESGKDDAWSAALRKGGAWSTEPRPGAAPPPAINAGALRFMAATRKARPRADEAELWLWASIMLDDGLASGGSRQKAPDPIGFMARGNWIDLHPRQAAVLDIEDGDLVQLATSAGTMRAPARLTREVGEHTVALRLGQGHAAPGGNAQGVEGNAFALLGLSQSSSMFATCRVSRVPGRDRTGAAVPPRNVEPP